MNSSCKSRKSTTDIVEREIMENIRSITINLVHSRPTMYLIGKNVVAKNYKDYVAFGI